MVTETWIYLGSSYLHKEELAGGLTVGMELLTE